MVALYGQLENNLRYGTSKIRVGTDVNFNILCSFKGQNVLKCSVLILSHAKLLLGVDCGRIKVTKVFTNFELFLCVSVFHVSDVNRLNLCFPASFLAAFLQSLFRVMGLGSISCLNQGNVEKQTFCQGWSSIGVGGSLLPPKSMSAKVVDLGELDIEG